MITDRTPSKLILKNILMMITLFEIKYKMYLFIKYLN